MTTVSAQQRIDSQLTCRPTIDTNLPPRAVATSPFPDIDWTPCSSDRQVWYRVQVATDRSFMDVSIDEVVQTPRFVPDTALDPGEVFVRVRAESAAGRGAWAPAARVDVAQRDVITVPADASTDTMRELLETAMARGHDRPHRTTVVRFTGDRHELDCGTLAEEEPCFDLSGARNLMIDGGGAAFVVTNPTSSFVDLTESRDVTLRNFSVDYDPLPFSETTIIAKGVDGSGRPYVIADVTSPDMPGLLDPHMTFKEGVAGYPRWGQLLDSGQPGTLVPSAGGVINVPSEDIVDEGSGTYRLYSPRLHAEAEIGDIFRRQARINGRSIVNGAQITNLALDRITAYASPSGLVNPREGHGLTVVNSAVRVKDGRYASTNADGIHGLGMTRGPWVENSVFHGLMDDVVNLRPIPHVVTEITDGGQALTLADSVAIPVGTEVAGYVFADGTTTRTTVEQVDIGADDTTVLHLAAPITQADVLYGMHDAAPLTTFRNDAFVGGLRYGLLLRTVDTTVESTLFDTQDGAAMIFENHPWRGNEGLMSLRARVINNVVARNRDIAGSVQVGLLACGGGTGPTCTRERAITERARPHEDLQFVANEVTDWTGHGIALRNGRRNEIACNLIGEPSGSPQTPPASIRTENTADTTVVHNRVANGLVALADDGGRHADNGPETRPDAEPECQALAAAQSVSPRAADGLDLPAWAVRD
ncbi:hypothetical protein [Jiangella asiatica]|uniref:Right-handed parallel beta-helix repeat-containing protein n=1 Tax=Jiangella asiatica TaxID=2530372 RepID=A0A4R5D4V3_9ACTN|nr:hypothetical protein [Jiangella asiatica]TDE08356.1 hypothetical protein E1269_17795 [Jiangella asiatica]